MGSVEEIHDRDRQRARELIRRLAHFLRDHEHAVHLTDPDERNNGFTISIDFDVNSTPLTLQLIVHP